MPNLEGMFCKYLYLSIFDGLVGKVPEANLHRDFMVFGFLVLAQRILENEWNLKAR